MLLSKTEDILRKTRDKNAPTTGRDCPFSSRSDNVLDDRSPSRSSSGRCFSLKEFLRDPLERRYIDLTEVCIAGGRRSGGGSGSFVRERYEDWEMVRGERGGGLPRGSKSKVGGSEREIGR